MSSASTIVVLVPGAWHDPAFAFNRNIASLKQHSIESITIDLPTCAPKDSGPRKTFADDVALIRKTVTELSNQGKEIVVACHSYGGFPVAEALERLGLQARKKEGKAGGVKRIVYIAAFLVPENMTLLSAVGNKDLPWWDVQGDIVYAINPETVFYNDVEPSLADTFVKELRPFSYSAFSVPLTYCAWREIPTSYILCTQDQALPYHVQQQLVQNAGLKEADVVTCDAGHSPFISQPNVVLEMLKKAVNE